MNTKITVICVLLSAGLSASAFAAGGRSNGASAARQGRAAGTPGATCTLAVPGQGTPLRDGSGKAINQRGNPNATGTPLRDGSGRATAPGQGPKNGTGPNCPNPPGT